MHVLIKYPIVLYNPIVLDNPIVQDNSIVCLKNLISVIFCRKQFNCQSQSPMLRVHLSPGFQMVADHARGLAGDVPMQALLLS